MQLDAYLFFYGRCEEALEFYKTALRGTYEMTRFGDSPMGADAPPESRNRVMHATFTGSGFEFMCSDGRGTKSIDPDESNMSLSLATSDAAEGERVFKALAEGGTVTMPLDKVPWGGTFGMLADRFGVEWMVSIR
jgi:PhnB protein